MVIPDFLTVMKTSGLGWIVKLGKGAPFVGESVLKQLKESGGVKRRLAGFKIDGRGVIPRHGYGVYLGGDRVDMVRSGGFSPSLRIPIGTTYLPIDAARPGSKIEIECRGKRVAAEVVELPFYSNGSVRARKA